MYVVKTALRESFYNIHVGFLYSSKNETIKIETARGKNKREGVVRFRVLPRPLHDRMSALRVIHTSPQECIVRLSSTLLLKNIVFH